MTIVLNGTTGITNDGGYTGDGVVFADTTPANTLVTTTGGNVGIGTSSPGTKLDVDGQFRVRNGGATGYAIIEYGASSTAANNWHVGSEGDGSFRFYSGVFGAGAERARFDSGGNFLVGGSTTLNSARQTIYSSSGICLVSRSTNAAAGKYWNIPYIDSNNTMYVINQNNAGVYLNDGGTSWSANSDERLKDIIEPITDAANKVSTLRAVIGKYKTDDEGKRRSFLIAQDVEAVLPEAISRSKLPMSDDETEYLGVTYTDTIPLLVAAIQEQQAIITGQDVKMGQLVDQLTNAESTMNLLTEMFTESQQTVAALTARVEALEGTQP
jgi:hypothetical protein